MSKQNYSVARVKTRTQESVGKFERHIERKNEHYANMNVDLERMPMNVSFRDCGELTYNEMLQKLVDEGKVSMRGLKKDAKVYDELIFDINSEYFEEHGGYEFAKAFYEEAYYFAEKLYGKDNILSAVVHADEINLTLSDKYGYPVYHYHMHVMALPVVEKKVLWSKRCKDKSLIGTVKEIINQISHSKKWKSPQKLNEYGEPEFNEKGKPYLCRLTVFCKTNSMNICKKQALGILKEVYEAVPHKTKVTHVFKPSRIKSALRQFKKRLSKPMRNCPQYYPSKRVPNS